MSATAHRSDTQVEIWPVLTQTRMTRRGIISVALHTFCTTTSSGLPMGLRGAPQVSQGNLKAAVLPGSGIKACHSVCAWPPHCLDFEERFFLLYFQPHVTHFLCLLCLGREREKECLQLQIKVSYHLNMTSSRSLTHQFQSNFPNISSRHWTRCLVK